MELPLLNASGKPIRPPYLWYYSGWTREGVPDPAFGIKQVVHSPANHDNDFVARDNVSETENPGLVVEGEQEDEEIVQFVQQGIRSRFYHYGRYATQREQGTHHFHSLLADDMNR